MVPWSVFPEDDLPQRVLGLCGTMGSGKTTFAQMCQQQYGAKIASMAEPIRRLADSTMMQNKELQSFLGLIETRRFLNDLFSTSSQEALGKITFEIAELYRECQPKAGEKNRTFLQKLGDIARREKPSVWIDWRKAHMPEGLVVIDDIRFPDEVKMVEELGGKMYRIARPELDRLLFIIDKQGGITKEQLNHPSETALKEMDIPVLFANNLDELEAHVESVMEGV